jgi:4-hydroxy-2-oxoheptanedioate aldolase
MSERISLKERLGRGEVCFGPFAKLTDPAAVEVLALAGFDHVIIDMEHGPVSVQAAQDLIRAAQLRGMAPVARVPRNDASDILRVLDIGAEGVHVPQIATAEDARAAVEACYFHPEGTRGVCRFVRAADYAARPAQEHFAEANRRTLPVLHIEGQEGIANLPEILSVPGIGVVFVGPYDLSQSCGVPGQVQHPMVIERMRHAVGLARDRGAVVGTFIEDAEGARIWAGAGVQYLCYSVDVGILMAAAKRAVGELRRAVEGPSP